MHQAIAGAHRTLHGAKEEPGARGMTAEEKEQVALNRRLVAQAKAKRKQ